MTTTATARPVIRINNFVTAILAGLADRGFSRIDTTDDAFYLAFVKAYEVLKQGVGDEAEVRFSLYLDPIHGTSPRIRERLNAETDKLLVSRDNPKFVKMRLALTRSDANEYLDAAPGGRDIYEPAIRAFIAAL